MPINFTRKYFKRKKLPLRPLFSSYVFVTMKTRKRNPTLVMTRFYIGVFHLINFFISQYFYRLAVFGTLIDSYAA